MGTLASVAAAISLRQVTITLAFIGIIAKIGLFVWVGHTSTWTVGTSSLTVVTIVLGLLTMTLAAIDFVRSRGEWLPLVTFVLGLVTFAPVLGYSASPSAPHREFNTPGRPALIPIAVSVTNGSTAAMFLLDYGPGNDDKPITAQACSGEPAHRSHRHAWMFCGRFEDSSNSKVAISHLPGSVDFGPVFMARLSQDAMHHE